MRTGRGEGERKKWQDGGRDYEVRRIKTYVGRMKREERDGLNIEREGIEIERDKRRKSGSENAHERRGQNEKE